MPSNRYLAVIRQDLRHFLDGPLYSTPRPITAQRLVLAILSTDFRVVFHYRTSHWFFERGWHRVAYLIYLRAKRTTGCDISMEATIGAGFRVCHAQDVVIGPEAVIGQDCVVFNGATLGNRDFLDPEFHMPVLGDRVHVGTGAKLLGDISIGDGARIGANSVVLSSVPAGVTVAGNPARQLA